VLDDPSTTIVVDLEALAVTAPTVQESFAFDDFRRWCLLEGYDDVDLTMRHIDEIAAYEAARPGWLPNA
ncbi:MAG TPA: 3-isopropylmalate dehydratase small subunit, partial [Actinomycetota bacterium]|nr:3-isopropylmalate dehydratase small subunit [Actinomycetota bacterium]